MMLEERRKRADVIIPVYRPDEKLKKLLEGLRKQTHLAEHIFLIHTKTEGVSLEWCKEYETVQIIEIRPEEFDHGGTRRMGAELSDEEFLIFMTQDAVPQDQYLIEKLMEPFQDSKVGASYARQLPDKDCRMVECYTRSFNYPQESRIKTIEDVDKLGIKTFFCSNVCAAYKKSVYKELGGFVPRAIFNEDMILAGTMIKAGYGIAYAADAKVIHSHNYSGRQQFHRNFDLAVSQKDHPEIFAGISSESEGIRLVISTVKYLLKNKKGMEIPGLIVQSGCKFLGYKLGLHYEKLPEWLVLRCTMNKIYWKSQKNA